MGVGIVLVMRLTVPLTIFRWPLLGGVLAIVADTVDILVFQAFGFPSFGYHELDKLLDTYYLAIEVIVAQRWEPLPRTTASALFAYRLLGVALFEWTDDRTVLLIFPNLFEFFFLLYAARLRFLDRPELTRATTPAWLAVLLVPKMAQEYTLHYARLLDHAVALDIIRHTMRRLF
jgi:hypothetical protein